jgi:hypothetical protein
VPSLTKLELFTAAIHATILGLLQPGIAGKRVGALRAGVEHINLQTHVCFGWKSGLHGTLFIARKGTGTWVRHSHKLQVTHHMYLQVER